MDVLIVGDINIDITMPVNEYPVEGKGTILDRLEYHAGGGGLNTALVLAKLGINTSLAGCIGEDAWAIQINEILSKNCIDRSNISVDAITPTGFITIIVSPDGERTMLSYRGANRNTQFNKLQGDELNKYRLLHLSGYVLADKPQSELVVQFIKSASQLGIPVSIDTGLEPVLKSPGLFLEIMPYLFQCILGIQETQALFNTSSYLEAAEIMSGLGVGRSVIKLGKDGCFLKQGNNSHKISAFPVQVVDTTGAGDAFSAGLLMGWLSGFSLVETGVLANALGALSTTVKGAGDALPGSKDLISFFTSLVEMQQKVTPVFELDEIRKILKALQQP